jgi:Ion channel
VTRIARIQLDDWRFVQLSITFVVLMMVMPVLEHHLVLKTVVSLFLLNAMLVAISTHAGRVVRVVLWSLWGVTLVAGILEELPIAQFDRLTVRLVTVAALSVMVAICASRILRVVFQAEQITLDSIFGSIVAYQLIGLFFSGIYTTLVLAEPNSFHGSGISSTLPGVLETDMVYYSFVTLATLGYGDIVPASSLARSIAVTEALVGQFYVAVVVAVLIGAYVSRRRETG